MNIRPPEIERSVAALTEEFGATEIWLFGSWVGNTADKHSDIDLLVIRPARKGSPRPSLEARLCLSRRGIHRPFDLIVLTPKRWQEAKKKPFGVYGEILERGAKLYEG